MRIDPADLDWLHDGDVHAVRWLVFGSVDEQGERIVEITVTVPDNSDLGDGDRGPFAHLTGRALTVRFRDVAEFTLHGRGEQWGGDTFDGVRVETRPDGDVVIGIAFHTGSELTIRCRGVEWAPGPSSPRP